MKTGEWHAWLTDWLKRHPLKQVPPESLRGFRQEVMSRIRAQESSAPATVAWRWLPKPRLAFALGGALAAVLALVVARPLLQRIAPLEEEALQLAEVGEVALLEEEVEAELEETDRLVLAQAAEPGRRATNKEPAVGDAGETVSRLEQEAVDLWAELEELEEVPADAGATPEEDLLEELQGLDEAELALS